MTGIEPVLCPSKGLILPLNYTTLKAATVLGRGIKFQMSISTPLHVLILIALPCYPFSAYTDATGLHWYRQVLTLAFT